MKCLKLYSTVVSARWKNFKPKYYFRSFLRLYLPRVWSQSRLHKELSKLSSYDEREIFERVDYYNKSNEAFSLGEDAEKLSDFKYRKYCKNYFFDMYEYTRYFSDENKIKYQVGDVTQIESLPTIVKSRPISGNNENSVLLNLNKIRHFLFVNDTKSFEQKKNKVVWRGNLFHHQSNRKKLLEKFHNHPLCDVIHVNKVENFPYEEGEKMTLHEQLKYKFIISLEGNDVATNLKWIMSSNSIAVSPRLCYETWFMEGKLIPNYHYIQVADDYSDLEERIAYYLENPRKATDIVKNANNYVAKFKDKEREKLISLLTLQKYFDKQL